MRLSRIAAFAGALLAASPVAHAATYYIDGTAGSNGNGSFNSPWKTFWQVPGHVSGGDTIYVRPTTPYYDQGISGIVGYYGGQITFEGTVPGYSSKAVLSTNSAQSPFFITQSSYVTIDGFEANGNGQYQTTGLQVSSQSLSNLTHHITLSNNYVHNAGGDGISIFQSDYITITGNTVTNNSWGTQGGVYGSGISLLNMVNSDGKTWTHNFISNNFVYGNSNQPNCSDKNSASCSDSDGSGIIMDANWIPYQYSGGVYPGYVGPGYTGRTLIDNNVVYNNGGRCVHVFRSRSVDIQVNTCAMNNADPYVGYYHVGEVHLSQADDVSVYNNIFAIRGGLSDGAHNNIGYGWAFQAVTTDQGSATYSGSIGINNNWTFYEWATGATSPDFVHPSVNQSYVADWSPAGAGDPKFASPGNWDANSNLEILAGSPTFNHYLASDYSIPLDILGWTRNANAAVGAYGWSR